MADRATGQRWDMPEVGKTVQAGDSVAVCTKVE